MATRKDRVFRELSRHLPVNVAHFRDLNPAQKRPFLLNWGKLAELTIALEESSEDRIGWVRPNGYENYNWVFLPQGN